MIVGNGAEERAGGIFGFWSCPIPARCEVRANTAAYGAVIACNAASPTVDDSTLADNQADWNGGALWLSSYYNYGVDATISRTTISSNQSGGSGGAIYAD